MRRPWPQHCIGLDVMGSKTAHNLRIYFAALSLLLATPLAAWCQQSTPTAGEVLSLDQAINIALQNNRSLKNARINVEKGEDEIRNIRTSRLPSTHFYALVSEDMVKHETNLNSHSSTTSSRPITKFCKVKALSKVCVMKSNLTANLTE